jgi:hypothetical protein
MTKLAGIPYTIHLVNDLFGIDPDDDNVDVSVQFITGERYIATFFTVGNLQSLMEGYRKSGECAAGLYVWSAHMIVIAHLTRENIERAVAALIDAEEFAAAFDGPYLD